MRRSFRAASAMRPSRIAGRRSKYGAVKTIVDGFPFASKKEASRYGELKLLEKAGEIRGLVLQPAFELHVAHRPEGGTYNYPRKVGIWRGDFQYEERRTTTGGRERWDRVVEDVKGFKTPVYRLKKRIVEAQYGVTIRET